jgi:hypothetical protein
MVAKTNKLLLWIIIGREFEPQTAALEENGHNQGGRTTKRKMEPQALQNLCTANRKSN